MIKVLKIHTNEPEYICIAAEELRQGKLVAFPIETVYGLGANALDARSVAGFSKPRAAPTTIH